MNSPTIAIITLLGFIWLAHASLHRETGYTHSVFSVLDKKPSALLQRQAEALRGIYNLTDDDVAKRVRIFGEP